MAAPGPLELLIISLICLGPLLVVGIVAAVLSLNRRSSQPPGNPNLQPCPDCGRMVSPMAETCPQCGRPLKNP